MYKELGINLTEARQLARQAGSFARRDATLEALELVQIEDSAQYRMRRACQEYIEENYEQISDLLSCSANCASSENRCTDAQALVCFQTNKHLMAKNRT